MRVVEWEASMNGASWDGEIEVDDTATDDEINDLVREEVGIISWGWRDKQGE